MPLLQVELLELSGLPVAVYGVLQHVSTFVGAAVLCVWYFRWYVRAQPGPLPTAFRLKPKTKVLAVLGLFFGVVLPACVRMSFGLGLIHDLCSLRAVMAQAAITGLSCGLAASTALCLLLLRLEAGARPALRYFALKGTWLSINTTEPTPRFADPSEEGNYSEPSA